MALSESEISALLPDDDKQKINNAFEALSQTMPTPKEQAILYRVAHTLKLSPTDSVFSFLAATHLYYQLYQAMPAKIISAGDQVADKILRTIGKSNISIGHTNENNLNNDVAKTYLDALIGQLESANKLGGANIKTQSQTNEIAASTVRTNMIICVCSIFSSAICLCIGFYFGKHYI
jgi:hypothetical protein